jgi:hypothetical protein
MGCLVHGSGQKERRWSKLIGLGIFVATVMVLTALMIRRQWRHGGSRWGVHADRARFDKPPEDPQFKDGLGWPKK